MISREEIFAYVKKIRYRARLSMDANAELCHFHALYYWHRKRTFTYLRVYASPQHHITSWIGFRLCPNLVNEYSTRGGTSA